MPAPDLDPDELLYAIGILIDVAANTKLKSIARADQMSSDVGPLPSDRFLKQVAERAGARVVACSAPGPSRKSQSR
jgi:hypothetical protein